MRFFLGVLFILAAILDFFMGGIIAYELRKEKYGLAIGCITIALTVINIFCIYQAYARLM